MEEDLFNGYDAGMMSPGRIAQLAVDGRVNKSLFPTPGELLAKQTDSVLPSIGLSSQVKSSPITVPAADAIFQAKETAVAPITNNTSTTNNSTVNNSFDYSKAGNSAFTSFDYGTQGFSEGAKSIINDIFSSLSKTYVQEETANSKFNTMQALSMSPSTVINQINKSFDIPKSVAGTTQNISKTSSANSIVNSMLNLVNEPRKTEQLARLTPAAIINTAAKPAQRRDNVTGSNVANPLPISPSAVMPIMDMTKSITNPSTSYIDTIYSLINTIGPSTMSLAESTKVESIDESSTDTTSNFMSAMENLRSVTNNESRNSQFIDNSKYSDAVSVKSSNPIKNKSLVNQILNPPNLVAQGVDNLGKVITNTTNTMTSNITDKLSTLTPVAQTESSLANQIVNNNSSNTVNQSSQLAQPAAKEATPAEEMAMNSLGLSEYYLQAIHDALIVQGIKIRHI